MGGCADSMQFGCPNRVPTASPGKVSSLPGCSGALAAHLPAAAAPAEIIFLPDPLDPSSWTVQCGTYGAQPIHGVIGSIARSLGPPASGLNSALECVFVQFRMDNLGRHEYVCLGEVEAQVNAGGLAAPLTVRLEDEVKALKRQHSSSVVILTAALPEDSLGSSAQTQIHAFPQDEELCPPRGCSRNYNIVEELTLGPTQRVMLSDENTLHVGVERNGVKIFNYLSLIVNCHERESEARGGYNVGTANPKILYRPIHFLMREDRETRIRVMNEIQEEFWRCLQHGSVVVHCLAGVHRAPTVVVCHYLYRHYVLGHKEVDTDVNEIYKRLRALRGNAVDALGYRGPIIDTYREYLVQTYGQGCSSTTA